MGIKAQRRCNWTTALKSGFPDLSVNLLMLLRCARCFFWMPYHTADCSSTTSPVYGTTRVLCVLLPPTKESRWNRCNGLPNC